MTNGIVGYKITCAQRCLTNGTADVRVQAGSGIGKEEAIDEDTDQVDEVEVDEADEDPQCANCGWYRSEHAMSGCSGFVSAASWKAEKELIYEFADREARGEIDPGWEWWDR